jgi:hypothetical protein
LLEALGGVGGAEDVHCGREAASEEREFAAEAEIRIDHILAAVAAFWAS